MINHLEVVAKWRVWFAGWQLGTRPKGDPECDAVSDLREQTILMRVELNAIAGLLIEKSVMTAREWTERLQAEAKYYDGVLSKRFPGVVAHELGLTFTPEVAETMRKMNFKP